MAGERPSTEDDRWAGFTKGMRATDKIKRDEHEFVRLDAPSQRSLPKQEPKDEPPADPPENLAALTHYQPRTYEDDRPEAPLVPKLERARLDDIANMLRAATYGEMIELAGEIWHFREVGDINQDTLPAILHGWAIQRGKSNGR